MGWINWSPDGNCPGTLRAPGTRGPNSGKHISTIIDEQADGRDPLRTGDNPERSILPANPGGGVGDTQNRIEHEHE
jgi:hypothetical protein